MPLSYEASLVFIRHTGVFGRLTSGRVERRGPAVIDVYSPHPGTINEYISGSNLRSWCILGSDRKPIGDWHSIQPEDRSRLLASR
jgi:hypothetical protein